MSPTPSSTACTAVPDDPDARAHNEKEMAINTLTAGLLDEICGWLRRFVWFPKIEQADVLALYVMHTYVLETFGVTPYVVVLSARRNAARRCCWR